MSEKLLIHECDLETWVLRAGLVLRTSRVVTLGCTWGIVLGFGDWCVQEGTGRARGGCSGEDRLRGALVWRHLLSPPVPSPLGAGHLHSVPGAGDGSMCCLPPKKRRWNPPALPLPFSSSFPDSTGKEGLGALSGSASTSLCRDAGELWRDKLGRLAASKSASRAVTACLAGTVHVETFHRPGSLLDRWSQLQIPPALPVPRPGCRGECILVLHLKAQSFWEVSLL